MGMIIKPPRGLNPCQKQGKPCHDSKTKQNHSKRPDGAVAEVIKSIAAEKRRRTTQKNGSQKIDAGRAETGLESIRFGLSASRRSFCTKNRPRRTLIGQVAENYVFALKNQYNRDRN